MSAAAGKMEYVVGAGPIDTRLVADGLAASDELLARSLYVRERSEDAPSEHVRAIVARANVRIDDAAMAALPRLRVIARTGVGFENVDVEAATRRGVAVVTTPGSSTNAVAEGVLAHTLALVKRLSALTDLVRTDQWARREEHAPGDLEGTRVGLVGFGRIGRRVAQLFGAFGADVAAYDPQVDETDGTVRLAASMDALVADSSIVSLHLPQTPQTAGMVNARFLAQMPAGALLINHSRGGLVELDALLEHLETGHIAGAGLDVFPQEPPARHPVFDHPNVILTPHMMGLSRRAAARTFFAAGQGIGAVLAGRSPEGIVNPNYKEH